MTSKFLKRVSRLGLSTALLFALMITPASAFAEPSDNAKANRNERASQTGPEIALEQRASVADSEVSKEVQKARKKAENETAKHRKNSAKLDVESRKQLCQNRRGAINNKLNAYSKNSDQYLEKLESVHSKLAIYNDALSQDQQSDMQKAVDAQMLAATKVAALKTVLDERELTCDELTDNATWLAAVKVATDEAKSSLKDYRDELKNVVSVLKDDQPNDPNKTESTDTDSSETAE